MRRWGLTIQIMDSVSKAKQKKDSQWKFYLLTKCIIILHCRPRTLAPVLRLSVDPKK